MKRLGNEVNCVNTPIDAEELRKEKYDLGVSYTYRYIVSEECLAVLNHNIVNLHISLLPWNRGACPNQWSWIDDTPKGVTIHYMDRKLDTGDIIIQKEVQLKEENTFFETYQSLNVEIVKLFKEIFPYYSQWNDMKRKQEGKGTYHNLADYEKYRPFIQDYHMKISDFLTIIEKEVMEDWKKTTEKESCKQWICMDIKDEKC